jgi:hypothetical protein
MSSPWSLTKLPHMHITPRTTCVDDEDSEAATWEAVAPREEEELHEALSTLLDLIAWDVRGEEQSRRDRRAAASMRVMRSMLLDTSPSVKSGRGAISAKPGFESSLQGTPA